MEQKRQPKSSEGIPKIPTLDIKLWKEKLIQEAIERVMYWKQFGLACVEFYEESVSTLEQFTLSVWPTENAEKEISLLNKLLTLKITMLKSSGQDTTKDIKALRKQYADDKFNIVMRVIRDRGMWGRASEYTKVGLGSDEEED